VSHCALALLVAQVSVWSVSPDSVTIGDTVTISLRLVTEPGVSVHAEPMVSGSDVESLSVPLVRHVSGGVIVEYRVAVFEPGYRGVAMPEMQLVHEDGSIQGVPGDTAWVDVVPVLPAGEDSPPPKPSIGPFARGPLRPDLPVFFMASALGATLVWTLVRRRVRQRPAWRSGIGKRVDAPVVIWLEAGESRAVVSAVTDRLRESIEAALPEASRQLSTQECLGVIDGERPLWPALEISSVLQSLDRARFAPAVPADIMDLVERADELAMSIKRSVMEDSAP